MVQYREFEGKNLATAIENACKELQIPKKKLKHDILSYGSTGIFGLSGSKKARIRVKISESANLEKKEAPAEAPDGFIDDVDEKEDITLVPPEDTVEEDTVEEEEEEEEEEVDQEAVFAGKEALEKIVAALTEEAVISSRKTKSHVVYHVEGGNTAVLIGKRGQTLEAIKTIIEKIVNKKSENRRYVQVDIGGYLEKRKQNLEKMAKSSAEKASRTGKPVSLGQMNARDRRIVHLALKTDKAVKTQSLGDGHIRKLMVFPKKRNNRQQRSPEKNSGV